MTLKKIFVLLFVFVSCLFAQPTQSEIISAVKSNPALLDTPQAQAQMLKRGISKKQVLLKINNTTAPSKPNSKDIKQTVKNNIVTKKENKKVEGKQTKVYNINRFSNKLNPLVYNNNSKLLAQIKSKQSIVQYSKLKRFGIAFFKNKNTISNNIIVPDFYILNPNDTVSIWIYGAKNDNFELKINNQGKINIPKIGPISIGGLKFKDAKKAIKSKLQPSFKNSEIIVNISKLSTMQVTLTGFVKAPGVYNVSSLSTIKDLLIASNGVKANGSLRNIIIKRDGKRYKTIDFYKLITIGDDSLNILLKANDVVYVPKALNLVKLDGDVNNKAIYELKNNETLASLLRYAGGLKTSASKFNIKIQRYIEHKKIKIFNFDYDNAEQWKLKDSDSVYVYDIDKVHRDSIVLYGNVVRPGKMALGSNHSLQDLFLSQISKFGLSGVFLENTLFNYGVIKRQSKNLTKQFINFNLQDILNKKLDISLKQGDEIYIFNKFDTQLNPFVTIKGKVVAKEGKYQFIEGMTVADLIKIAGTISPYDITKIKITTYDQSDYMPLVKFINEKQAQAYKLKSFDTVELYDYYLNNALQYATISGNINFPGKFIVGKNMTIKDCILSAGGLKPYTFTTYLRIARTQVVDGLNGKEFQVKNIYLNVEDIMANKKDNIVVKDKDKIFIYSIEQMSQRAKVTISGEVKNPGSYFIASDTTVQDIVKAAGGITNKAYKQKCEVVRYIIQNNQRTTKTFTIANFLDKTNSFKLKEFDEIRISRIPNWNNKKSIIVKGEVKFPGTYVIKTGDKLGDVIKRAGGYTKNAFLEGAIFTRESIKKMQRAKMKESILQLKQKSLAISTQPTGLGEGTKKVDAQGLINLIDSLAKEAEKLQPIGRITIALDENLSKFQQSPSNLVLENNDTLIIPSKNDTVLVMGEVMSPTAIIFEGDDLDDYIDAAGGLTQRADEDSIYIVHANGSASKANNGWFSTQATIKTGDVIVVPQELITYSGLQIAKDIASIMYQFALTAASLHVVGGI